MLGAGLLARNAVAKGLKVKPWVKTSFAPGSQVVTEYLEGAGLWPSLNQLGFNLVGYGCTTCIGNAGPLPPHIQSAIEKRKSRDVLGFIGQPKLRSANSPEYFDELFSFSTTGGRLRTRRKYQYEFGVGSDRLQRSRWRRLPERHLAG